MQNLAARSRHQRRPKVGKFALPCAYGITAFGPRSVLVQQEILLQCAAVLCVLAQRSACCKHAHQLGRQLINCDLCGVRSARDAPMTCGTNRWTANTACARGHLLHFVYAFASRLRNVASNTVLHVHFLTPCCECCRPGLHRHAARCGAAQAV